MAWFYAEGMHNFESLNGLSRQLIVLRMDFRMNVFEELTLSVQKAKRFVVVMLSGFSR